jgi:CrcB protein
MIRALILVAIGGGLGSVLRYSTSLLMQRFYPHAFPVGTLLVNVLGCFLIGILIASLGKINTLQDDIRLLLVTGFCGGFTTFSAFAYENMQLMQSGQLQSAVLYIFVSVALCLLAVWIGMLIGVLL